MELKDFLFTPITLLVIYVITYFIRNRVTNDLTRAYFIPGLTVKIVGALGLGLVYQYYYQGGDTFNYFNQSQIVHNALLEDPWDGIRLLLANGNYDPNTFQYATQIYWYRSPSEYFVIKLAAVLGLLNSHSYTSIAVLFATFCFSGVWALYQTFFKIAPQSHFALALCILFVPSVFFWGSGLMKDTIALGALGWLFYGIYQTFIAREKVITSAVIILIAILVIFTVKIYILLSFLPVAIFWVFLENGSVFRSSFLNWAFKPIILGIGLTFAYLATTTVTEGDPRYDLQNIGERTKINAEYLYRISVLQGGSAYYLGELDGSLERMTAVAPQAIIVTLFRPFIWEVENPLMLFSALESLIFSFYLLTMFYYVGVPSVLRLVLQKPVVSFCFGFTAILALAVGLNSYNFGTLVRYKIQLLPFYLAGITLVRHYHTLLTSKSLHSQVLKEVPGYNSSEEQPGFNSDKYL